MLLDTGTILRLEEPLEKGGEAEADEDMEDGLLEDELLLVELLLDGLRCQP